MSDKVNQFLSECGGSNFTASAPRPPVPGEENEKESNGGMSTRSSGSHKSHQSHASSKSIGSNKGDINPATPRKSNLSCTVSGYDNEMDAPLGFEPEGSAANSPPFTENSTPPYIKWAESLHVLLDDRDGLQLFRTFLEQEGFSISSLEFWFACQGLKKGLKDKTDAQTIQIIKVIHKKYIKSDKLPFLEIETKRAISESIQSDIDLSIFNAAQKETEDYMTNEPYQLFLKSDLYVQYVSRGGESPKNSNSSSGSNSARPLSSGPLPTLKEDQELQQDDFIVPLSVTCPPKSLSRTPQSENKRQEYVSSFYPARTVPCHVSYAPVSAQDSEIQSLSSQDDALSLTDSSVDGHSHSNSRKHKRYRPMQRKAVPNRDLDHFIPRTDRAPKDRNIAEIDPEAFANKLIAALEKVLKEQEKEERVQMSLSKVLNQSDACEGLDKTYLSTASSRTNTTTTSLAPLLTSSMIDEENADSILDDHCSRIWEQSAHHTPSRSPGRHSPHSKSPDRFRKPFPATTPHSGTASMPGTLHNKSYKKRTELYSMSSLDSGVGDDHNRCSVETHRHIHHHHHHHHDRRKSKHKLEMQAQHHSLVCRGEPNPWLHNTAGARPKTASRSHSDATSNLDSGISMIESVGQPHPEVITTDPSTTKVLQWMLDNENMNLSSGTTHTDSEKTMTSRRSHKPSALTPTQQQPHKHSGSRKASSGHNNRSASADSSSRVPWVGQGAGAMGVLPSQPIATDPSMPIMPPPNTTVQLEEVNRRLEADHAGKATPTKSKSFTGVPSGKDKRVPMVPVSQSCSQVRASAGPSTRPLPGPVDQDTSLADAGRSDKRSSKRSSGSGNTSTSSKPDETVIGYYFCGEPIPYRITVPQPCVTLGQLKQLIGKRGFFRYFVKTYSKDFDTEAVYEEIKEDSKVLPVFEGKVVVKIDRIDEVEGKLSATSKKF